MKFCSECGGRIETKSPREGSGARYVCQSCHRCFFISPRLAVACLVEADDKVLLCQRAVDPDYGLWNLPGGFVEDQESPPRGGVRETLEEAGIGVEILRPYALIHIPLQNIMKLVFLARPLNDAPSPGPECLDARMFGPDEIPWESLAMSTTRTVLQRYFSDLENGELGFVFVELVPFPVSGLSTIDRG